MTPTRIEELLIPFLQPSASVEVPVPLSPEQLRSISTYIDLLRRWNARVNLTAIRDPEEIVTRHFGESILAARHLFADGRRDAAKMRLADLGSGAGFPGIPIKLWVPEIEVSLIESNQKKAAFLREVVRTLGLTGIRVENVRAETLPAATFDVVTLRAVERSESVLPVATGLLVPAGRLVALTTSMQVNVIQSALASFFWDEPIPVPQSRSRWVLMGRANHNS